MMDSELREYIGKSALDKQLIRHVESLLPADDAELDRWLADSLPRAYNEFVSVICAALLEGRHVDPRHLAQGGLILAAAGILPEVVMRMGQEDVPEYLLQEHIGELNQQTPTAPDRSSADMKESAEDELLLPHDSPTAHPVRLIGFPRDFDQRLRDVPRVVARATMTMLGRLAAGEPAAFVGAVRLKACPTVTRQRIGMDWRLLFRLLQDRIEVVDLIPRQDLERKIRRLSS